MSARPFTAVLLAAAMAACSGSDDSGAAGQESPAAEAAEAPAPATSTADRHAAGERPDATPVVAQIFDEMAEPSPPRRVTFHVLVARDATRDQLRQTLTDLLLEQAESDSSLVAARAIGYYGVQTSATQADMVPFVWAEWLPNEGWYYASQASRDELHRVYFYPEAAPQW